MFRIWGDGVDKSTMELLLAGAIAIAWLNQPYQPSPEPPTVSGRCPIPVAMARLAGGELPPGLQLQRNGQPAGVPSKVGSYRYQVEYSDGCSRRKEWNAIRVEPLPMLIADPPLFEYTAIIGGPTFSGGFITVSGGPAGVPYTVEVLDAAWLRALPRQGAIPESGLALESDIVTLRVDPKGLQPGNYSGRVRLFAWRGVNSPEVIVKLRVESVQTILPAQVQAIPVPEAPIQAPHPSVIQPPEPSLPAVKPTRRGSSRTQAAGSAGGSAPVRTGPVRSRILPFPKVDIRKPLPSLPEAKPANGKPSPMQKATPPAH